MKTILLALCISINFCVVGQTPSKSTVPQDAEIKFEKTTHDYGTVFQDANGDCEFKFKNSGAEPLIISDVRVTCGCTTPYYAKEPIMPGKSSVIKVHYDTKRLGVFNKTITVLSNAKTDQVVLNIKGEILEKK
ncbi:MAG: DUF1573 domain-containing protein [Bacteroidota bacterium]